MLYIVRGTARVCVCDAGELRACDTACRFFEGAAFFFALPTAFAFFCLCNARGLLLRPRWGFPLPRHTCLLPFSSCLGSVDGDLGQRGEGCSLPLDSRENEPARTVGEIEGESGLVALG